MLVEKLIGTSPSSTFADLKNNVRNANFSHKITFDYTDYIAAMDALSTPALTATVKAPLALEPGTTNEKGLLKGWLVRDVVTYIKTPFALPNLGYGLFDFGPNTDYDKFLKSISTDTAAAWSAYATQGDGDKYGYISTAHATLGGKLTCTSSGTNKLDTLTAGEIEVYMEIVDMNDLITEGAWATVTL